MKAAGHQVVGSGSASHEDVQMMYARFFGGESARVKKLLKEPLGSISARKILSQIFQVYYFFCTHTIYIACNFMTGCGYMYYTGNIWQCTRIARATPKIYAARRDSTVPQAFSDKGQRNRNSWKDENFSSIQDSKSGKLLWLLIIYTCMNVFFLFYCRWQGMNKLD